MVLDGYPSLFAAGGLRYQLCRITSTSPRTPPLIHCPRARTPHNTRPKSSSTGFAASGARCIKIFIEGGFGGGSNWPVMSKETLQRVRAATRKRGLPLLAHANAIDTQRIAVATEVDVHRAWLVELE